MAAVRYLRSLKEAFHTFGSPFSTYTPNFENRLILRKVIDTSTVPCFFDSRCRYLSTAKGPTSEMPLTEGLFNWLAICPVQFDHFKAPNLPRVSRSWGTELLRCLGGVIGHGLHRSYQGMF